MLSGAWAQAVIPDGSSATSATTAGTGRVTVDIAAKSASGISHNRYTSFNVPAAGVDLNNAVVGARTIINEVTSSNPTLIQGQLQVLGPRAHVIIANPNGITVDGGSFVNTGGVALATAAVSFISRSTAPGETQDNAVLTAAANGVLTVGAGGLSGAMSHLELISKQLRIDGAVTNSHSSSSADIRVTAGSSSVEFDSSVFPTNPVAPWSSATSGATVNTDAVLVDISRPGGLSASRVQIAVTDSGAGVRSAGTLLASAQDFTLASTGDVRLAGSVTAERDVIVEAASIATALQADGTGTSVTAGRHLDFLATAIDVRATALQAGKSGGGDLTLGKSGEAATGDMVIAGSQGADTYVMASASATGGLGLYAQGRNVTVEGASLAVDGAVEVIGNDITLRSPVDSGNTVQASRLAGGQTTITAAGSLRLDGFELAGINGLSATAASLTAQHVTGDEVQVSAISSSLGNVILGSTGAMALTATDIVGGENVKLTASAVEITAAGSGQDWHAGQVSAQNGGLVIKADAGAITNRGTTLQGKTTIGGDADSQGGVTLTASGNIVNRSLAKEALGIIFAATDDLVVTAGGALENHAGRLISNANVTLNATGDFDNLVTKTGGSDGTLVSSGSLKTGFWSRLFGGKSQSTSTVDYGDLAIPGTLAYVVGHGNVSITSANLRNIGGEIDANDGSIAITTGALTNEALTTGRAAVQVDCGFTCRTTPSGAVQLQGGTMSASRDVTITASGDVLNRGGTILAMQSLNVTAPRIRAEAITTWRAVAMPTSAFSAGNTRLLRSDQGGVFRALGGLVRLDTTDPVVIQGGMVNGSLGEDMSAGAEITAPTVESGIGGSNRPIGLFH